MSALEGALKWAKMGVPVFPCGMNKAPITPNGHLDAVTDLDTVTALFSNAGECLVGAAMGEKSGLFACDFDLYKPGAQEYMQELSDKGLLTDTQVHITAGGGLHFVYRSDAGYPNCKPHPSVEIKGEGGYIIVPPSHGYSIEKTGIKYADPALVKHFLSAKKASSSSSVDSLKQAILEGASFHDPLTQIAARRSAQGWAPERVQQELLEVLRASVASDPKHERHDRWAKMLANEGKELSRIVSTGNDKFNFNVNYDKLKESSFFSDIAGTLETDVPLFGKAVNGTPVTDKVLPSVGDWPFEKHGYFSQDHRDILNQKYVMYPLIAERETMLFAAEPKVGKTAVALKLAMCVARGENMGDKLLVSEARPVLYFTLEGARAVELRLEAERIKREGDIPEKDLMFVVDRPHDFLHEDQQVTNCHKIAVHNQTCREKFGVDLGLIVIDTLTKAMPGGDQNSVEDTSKLFQMIGMLREAGVNATICFIHHLSKQGNVRGSTNIEAEVDVVLGLEKHKTLSNCVVAKIRRARSIDENNLYMFNLESVYVGETAQGFQLHAPVVTLEGTVDASNLAAKAKDATQWADINETLVKELGIGEHGIANLTAALHNYVERPAGKRPNYNKDSVQKPLNAMFSGQHTWGWDGNYNMTLQREGNLITGITIHGIAK